MDRVQSNALNSTFEDVQDCGFLIKLLRGNLYLAYGVLHFNIECPGH